MRGLDVVIEPGERVLLLGASGSGKSTLLAGLAGLLEDDGEPRGEGSLTVDGHDVHDPALRGRVGLVLQDPASQTVLARCGDDVAFGCENLGVPRSEIWARVDRALDQVGLDVARDRPTGHLSGGQRQRLALAGVLAMSPGLLLLDEPTANLDPAGVQEVRAAVGALVADTCATLVVVEHRVEAWIDLVDRVVVLEPGGGVRADGAPREILAEHGSALANEGVWVPGRPPPRPARLREHDDTPPLLEAADLVVGPAAAAVTGAIDAQVRHGRCLVVEGENGTGKTTLALTMAGLLAPLSGRLDACDELNAGARRRPRRIARAARGQGPWAWRSPDLITRIGMVFQDPEQQFVTRTVREELRHGPLRAGASRPEADARADDLLDRLRLTRLAEANPYTLSGGEKRRLSVAGALATRPAVLILDEPTFGQDRLTWTELLNLLASLLDDGTAMVVVTHDDLVVNYLADDRLRLTPAAEPAVPR
ncbi:MAG: ABC transporter ATP-binding protein [Actinomycetales bacterium]